MYIQLQSQHWYMYHGIIRFFQAARNNSNLPVGTQSRAARTFPGATGVGPHSRGSPAIEADPAWAWRLPPSGRAVGGEQGL